MLGIMAASTCISPSIFRSGRRDWASLVASITFWTAGLWADPLVEKLSIATHGSTPRSALQDKAAAMAMSASCSTVGSGRTPVSAKMTDPSTPNSGMMVFMMLHPLRVLFPSESPTPKRAARQVSAVGQLLPATIPSIRPSPTIIAP